MISLAVPQAWGMVKVRIDMKKTRTNNPLRALAAMMLLAALGFALPASTPAANGGEGSTGVGANPTVARGMLIPARMRLIVRYSPMRSA